MGRPPATASQLFHFQLMRPWANYVTSLRLSFLRMTKLVTLHRSVGWYTHPSHVFIIITSYFRHYEYYQSSSSVMTRMNNQGPTDIQMPNSTSNKDEEVNRPTESQGENRYSERRRGNILMDLISTFREIRGIAAYIKQKQLLWKKDESKFKKNPRTSKYIIIKYFNRMAKEKD